MNLKTMLELLNGDLRNEWKHLHFYLANASRLTGLHCHEYKEFFLESAASEMKHVTAFSDLIVGLGGFPTVESNPFPIFCDPKEALAYALKMEEEVVRNYVGRQKDAQQLANMQIITSDPLLAAEAADYAVNGAWIEIFLDGQIQDSREDADHIKQILREKLEF